MNHPSSSSPPPAKSRRYRHRSRPVRKTERTAATNPGGNHSSFRHRPKSSSPKPGPQDASTVISFPVPSILTTSWLLETAPLVLARHLLYARGLWPMSVPQLFLLHPQDHINGFANSNRTGQDPKIAATSKRRRLDKISRINPSLRRKQQRAMDHITRLRDEWTRYAALTSFLDDCDNTSKENRHDGSSRVQKQQAEMPRFLLILLGSSYAQGRELYLLDFQSLIDEDDQTHSSANDARKTRLTQEQERKFESMLERKLISSLMNHRSDDEQPSVANSLPAQTSPSFRLWFTAGFKNRNVDDPVTGKRTCKTGSAHRATPEDNDSLAAVSDAAIASPLSTVSWIPRTKFPFSKQKPQSRSSSRKQSLVTIRFVRSQRQNQYQNASSSNNGEAPGNLDTSAPSMLHPTSEQLTWMSLPTYVKGFRL